MYAHYDKICNDPNRPKDYIESVYEYADGVTMALDDLFGSKCLPDEEEKMTEERYQYLNSLSLKDYDNETSADEQRRFCEYQHKHHPNEVIYLQTHSDEEPKPAEPKYHEGNKVLYNGYVYEIEGIVGKNRYALKGLNFDLDEDMIEPYTEPILQPFSQVKETKASVETGNNLFEQHFAGTSIAAHGKTDDHIADAGKMVRLNIAAMAMQGMLSNTTRFSSYEISDLVRISLNCADALISKAEKGGQDA